MVQTLIQYGLPILGAIVFLIFSKYLLGIVVIGEMQVGIVIKKFASKNLEAGQLIALNGEAGIQADTLSPGWYFFKFPWQYQIDRVNVVTIPQGGIGLIISKDGLPIPSSAILASPVDCDNFQNARSFFKNGGQKGRQLAFLTTGVYRINTRAFDVITSINSQALTVYRIEPDKVGIVTTLDGQPIDQGEIAGQIIEGHNNFQDVAKFLENGGRRGLQEQVLLSGSWNLNPWFVEVDQIDMTEVPIGFVGVVVAFVGGAHVDVSGDNFTQGDLVETGHKGIWSIPLYPGRHPINTQVMHVELVPTTNIVLNWANITESHRYDERLSSINVRSNDGFAFTLDVAQVIHIAALKAPKVIMRVGSVKNLVESVLQPLVGNYFRNASQKSMMLDFISDRSSRQKEAAVFVTAALRDYDVEGVDTLIGDITPPANLMQTQTDRKIASEQEKTYTVQKTAQAQRQELLNATALADIQADVVNSEQGIKIAKNQADAQIEHAKGESEQLRLKGVGEANAIQAIGEAKATAYKAGVEAMGQDNYTNVQLMNVIAEHNIRITPDVTVSGSDSGGGNIGTALLAKLITDKKAE